MAFEKFNSAGGFSVGIPAVAVVDENGIVIAGVDTTGNVAANVVYATTYLYSNGQPFSATPGGSNTQLQFNNNGVLGGIANVTWNGTTLSLGDASTLSISGGDNGYFLQTDGAGNLTWAAGGGGGGNGSPGGSNTQVQFNDAGSFGGDAGFTYNKLTNTLHVENIASGDTLNDTVNVTGNIDVTGNISVTTDIVATGNVQGEYLLGNGYYVTGLSTDVANYVAQPDQANITSLGNLLYLNVDGDITTLGNIAISGDYAGGNLSLSANVFAPNATFTNKVTVGSNLTINSAATLRVAGTLNTAGSPNLTLGTLSNIHITGGVGGQVLTTDGTGNLYWGTGGGGGGGSPGGTNQSIQFNNGGDFGGVTNFLFDVTSNRLSVPSIKISNVANFHGASNIDLGPVANLHIDGGLNGYVLQTDGSGNLSWVAGGGGGGGSVAGSNTQVQFNDNGNFGADAYFTYNNVSHTVQIGGNLIANSFQMGAGVYKWSTSLVYFATTTSSSPRQVLYSIPVSDISGVEFEIIATEPAGPSRQSCKISSLYYEGTVSFTEWGSLFINGGVGNFEVDYDAGDIITPPSLMLMITPNTSNPVTYKMLITQFAP
jgi:hypothetical protein